MRPVKNTCFRHPVYLQGTPDGKVIVMTIVSPEALGLTEVPTQAFCLADTMINAYTGEKPSMQLDPDQMMPADEWAKACDPSSDSLAGMGIAGILKSVVWFCQRMGDPFHGLLG